MEDLNDDEEITLPPVKYEYLDHPADVQLHSWGDTLEESFEQVAISMFAYITNMENVDIRYTMDIQVEGIDMLSLLFTFLDELLFNFCAEPYFVTKVRIKKQFFPNLIQSYLIDYSP